MSSRWPVDLSPRSLRREWNSAIRSSVSPGIGLPAAVRAMPSCGRGMGKAMGLSRARPARSGRPGRIGAPAGLFGLVLQQAPRGRREIKGFEVARTQRLKQHLELLGRWLSGIDDDEIFFAQPAGPAARAIADLAQQPLAPDLQSDALGRLRQLFDQGRDSRAAS